MLEHLIGDDLEPTVRETGAQAFVGISPTHRDAPSPSALLDAQVKTADWLTEMGLTEQQVLPDVQRAAAHTAFAVMTTGQSEAQQVEALAELEMPEAVRAVTAMLTAYDWEFVQEAGRIRNFVVTRLMEEANTAQRSGDRIKALTALGKVTEVGLFTEKVEVTKVEHTDEELDARIKERLAKLRGVQDALAGPVEMDDVSPKTDPAHAG